MKIIPAYLTMVAVTVAAVVATTGPAAFAEEHYGAGWRPGPDYANFAPAPEDSAFDPQPDQSPFEPGYAPGTADLLDYLMGRLWGGRLSR